MRRKIQFLLLGLSGLIFVTCGPVIVEKNCAFDEECVEGGDQGVCEGNALCSFADSNCPTGRRYGSTSGDVSDQCVGEAICGDGFCGGDETCGNCDADCGGCDDPFFCGDDVCTEASEDCESCERDCGECGPVCGDGSCNGDETCADCAFDCGACGAVCGDGSCNGDETCADCGIDCGTCSDEICDDGIDNDLDMAVDEGCGGTGY